MLHDLKLLKNKIRKLKASVKKYCKDKAVKYCFKKEKNETSIWLLFIAMSAANKYLLNFKREIVAIEEFCSQLTFYFHVWLQEAAIFGYEWVHKILHIFKKKIAVRLPSASCEMNQKYKLIGAVVFWFHFIFLKKIFNFFLLNYQFLLLYLWIS